MTAIVHLSDKFLNLYSVSETGECQQKWKQFETFISSLTALMVYRLVNPMYLF